VEEVPFSVLGSVTSVELNDLINKLIHSQVKMHSVEIVLSW